MQTNSLYSLSVIETWIFSHSMQLRGKAQSVRRQVNAPITDSPDKPDFDAIRAACTFVDDCCDSHRLDKPHWFAMANIVRYCRDGEEVFHEISASDPRYDQEERSRKLKHAKEGARPRTYRNIHQNIGYAGCITCPLFWKDQVSDRSWA